MLNSDRIDITTFSVETLILKCFNQLFPVASHIKHTLLLCFRLMGKICHNILWHSVIARLFLCHILTTV